MTRTLLEIAQTKPRARRGATRDEEHQQQAILFQRLALDPRTKDALIYAVPNFPGHVGSAKARLAAGKRAKAEGRRKGVPDINVDEMRGGYGGLRAEFKSAKGVLSREQREWLAKLDARGYKTHVWHSADEAFDDIVHYLSLWQHVRF